MVAWTVTTSVNASNIGGSGTAVVDGDSITINAGGTLTWDIANATGGIDLNGIAVNARGALIQNAGTRIDCNDGFGIYVAEGGVWHSNGTSGSGCIIIGEDGTNIDNTHYVGIAGRMFCTYTTISTFSQLGSWSNGCGSIELHNCTVNTMARAAIYCYYGGILRFVDCTITATIVSTHCLYLSGATMAPNYLQAIGCTFASTTDNLLGRAAGLFYAEFADCTYQAAAIVADDFTATTCDYDIRIYGKTLVTLGVADASVSPDHPSLNERGMLYDTTNYLKIPGYLPFDETNSSGKASVYLLQKSAYWPSTTTVTARTWTYWSDSSQSETGTNQKWTLTFAKDGYISDTDTDWAGNSMTGTLTTISPANNNAYGSTYSDSGYSTYDSTFYPSTTAYVKFFFTPTITYAVAGGSAMISYYDTDFLTRTTAWVSVASYAFTAGDPEHLETGFEIPAAATAGAHWFELQMTTTSGDTFYLYSQFDVLSASSTPTITTAYLSTASISELESALLTVTTTNMTTAGAVIATINNKIYDLDTTNYTTYTKTIYGHNIGIVASAAVAIVAEASAGVAYNSSAYLTVTTGATEAVNFIYTLLSDNWTTANVAKPTILKGGTARSKHQLSEGDFIKIYRSPRPTTRDPRFRRSYEFREDYVQLMIVTTNSSPRARLDALHTEVMRIMNAAATAPGSGWDKLWVEQVEIRKEFSEEFSSVMDITLTKILTAVNT